jgi:hypothetical protein
MSGAIPPLPNTPSWRGAQLKKPCNNFTFTYFLNPIGTFADDVLIRLLTLSMLMHTYVIEITE